MSKADAFLSKTLGGDFFESLAKVELWKPGTKSTIDHEELRTALQIVPRTVIALLIRELAPMKIGETKEIKLPVAENALLRTTKHERDVYSGEIEEDNEKVVEFKLRALPGVGLVIMSAFELYDMDNLINSDAPAPKENLASDAEYKIQHMIDERLSLHSLIGKVVDKKIMEKEAINQLVLAKLTEAIRMINDKVEVVRSQMGNIEKIVEIEGPVVKKEALPKKQRPLQKFLEERKKPKEFSVHMAKGESFQCPDCGKNIFNGAGYSGCICMGDDRERKIFMKKSESGIKLRFGRGWDPENIEMLLEVLQKKNK
jgi:hypothetical protein